MIDFLNLVPSVYPSASRDFQYLGRLFNIVLNSVKHNVDDMYYLPNTKSDPRLAELLALTLGFKVKRNYNAKQLVAIVSILPVILKYKGTKTAVDLAVNALMLATDSEGMTNSKISDNCVYITLPDSLVDTTLLIDLLPYILPAGLTCRLIKTSYKQDRLEDIKVQVEDTLYVQPIDYLDWTVPTTDGTDGAEFNAGLSSIYNITTGKAWSTANFIYSDYDANNEKKIEGRNFGLLNNSMIPNFTRETATTTALNDEETS